MVFEDAHWIDPTSRELLDLMVDRVRRLPVLLVVTFRPEFQPLGRPAACDDVGAQPAGEGATARRLVERSPAMLPSPRDRRTRSSSAPTACRCSSRS